MDMAVDGLKAEIIQTHTHTCAQINIFHTHLVMRLAAIIVVSNNKFGPKSYQLKIPSHKNLIYLTVGF